jgi:hypothetical protein
MDVARLAAVVMHTGITVTNICVEAGVARTSYYCSPLAAAVKEILSAPQTQKADAEHTAQGRSVKMGA